MSHFSLNLQSSDTLWYTPSPMDSHPHHRPQKPLPLFYHPTFKYEDVADQCDTTTTTTTTTTTSSSSTIDHEYMFEKPLTPSDVGKLNRLVIPKQHAEKYFPLSSTATSSAVTTADPSSTGTGGVLLGFEDESGKCWKFRYSYWNSSQSYVLTKGWSRYVKEKKLDAGDVVLFQRHRFENDRFFIGWRRRGSNPVQTNNTNTNTNTHNISNAVPVQNYAAHNFNAAPHPHQIASFSPYRRDSFHASGTEVRQKGRKAGGGNSKKVRLFGVNLECQIEEEEDQVVVEEDEEMSQTSDGSSLSSQGQGQGQGQQPSFSVGPNAYNYFDCVGYSTINTTSHYNNNHMDMNFPQDVNQMRNRLR